MTALSHGRGIVRGTPDAPLTLDDLARADELHIGSRVLRSPSLALLTSGYGTLEAVLALLTFVKFGRIAAYGESLGTWAVRDVLAGTPMIGGVTQAEALTHAIYLAARMR